jgi:hypothetical protein
VTIPLTLIGVGLAYGVIAAVLFRSRRLHAEHGALQVSELLDGKHTTLLGWFFGLVVGPVLVLAGLVWLVAVALS